MNQFVVRDSSKRISGSKGIYYDEQNDELHLYNKNGEEFQPAGRQGPQGQQGRMGLSGAKGDQGPQGEQGPIGATGPQGPQGEQGQQGNQGEQGQQGNTGAIDESILEDLYSRIELLELLNNDIQDYVDDNGEMPDSTEAFNEWYNKPDVLDYDYDNDGQFSVVDLWFLLMLRFKYIQGWDDYPITGIENNRYNGKVIVWDANGDGSVDISDAMVNIDEFLDYKHKSKICTEFAEMDMPTNLLKVYVQTHDGHFPTLEEFRAYINEYAASTLEYDYDKDGIISITDYYLLNYLSTNNGALSDDPKFDANNLTYNGISIDFNNDSHIDEDNFADFNTYISGLFTNMPKDIRKAIFNASCVNSPTGYKNLKLNTEWTELIDTYVIAFNRYPTWAELKDYEDAMADMETEDYVTESMFEDWQNLENDVLDYDYDCDGIYTYLDLYLPACVVLYKNSLTNEPRYNAENMTFNGKSLDINKDGKVTVTDVMQNIIHGWKHSSKRDLSLKNMPNDDLNVLNGLIGSFVSNNHYYPSLSMIKRYYIKLLDYDYDGDWRFSIVDYYLPAYIGTHLEEFENDPKFDADKLTYNGKQLDINEDGELDSTDIEALDNILSNIFSSQWTHKTCKPENLEASKTKIEDFINRTNSYPTLEQFNSYANDLDLSSYNWNETDLICEYYLPSSRLNQTVPIFVDGPGIEDPNNSIALTNLFDHIYVNGEEITIENIEKDSYGEYKYDITYENIGDVPDTYIVKYVLKDNVHEIPEYAFQEDRLTTVLMPNTINSIKQNAFESQRLRKFIIKATTPPTITKYGIFGDYDENVNVYVPIENVETYKSTSYWRNYDNIFGI